MTRIAIFGAGAIGGLVGAKLALTGADVTLVARGPHLAAIQANGLTLISDGQRHQAPVRAIAEPDQPDPHDYVIVTLKAHSLPAAAAGIARLMGPDSTLVTGINGIPYWYFHGLSGPFGGRHIESVDPGGAVSRILAPSRVIGAVVYPAAEVIEPGVIEHTYGDRFSLGEPDGSRSDRGQLLSDLMIKAGLKAPLRPHIRDEIWVKLWGNLAFNPLSALTGSTLERIGTRPDLYAIARAMMLEGQNVGEAVGAKFAIDVERRIQGAVEVGAHKTSMLQDLERGRPMEIDALLGAVVELGQLTGIATPTCDLILALVRERARLAGCYGE
jgi:2-dehydropantoate 2-reductase